jgi:HD-GYP domain-containing protein (c-di-GMP phosphodiesterase class II)
MTQPATAPASRGARVAELMATLSLAADIGSGYGEEHGLRSCLMALELGEAAGLRTAQLRDLYHLSLLRMIGCTADSHEAAHALGDEIMVGGASAGLDFGNRRESLNWLFHFGADLPPLERARFTLKLLAYTPDRRRDQLAAHCEVAGMLAAELGRTDQVICALGQVFERWDGRGAPAGLRGEAIDPLARIVILSADLAVLTAAAGIEEAVAVCERRAGSLHDPALVGLLARCAPRIDERLHSVDAWAAILAAEPTPHERFDREALERACAAIGAFADMKSRFTAGRSRAVSIRGEASARRAGFPEPIVGGLRQAGLVLDLGRVAVSAAVWDRPGPLSLLQRDRVRLFPLHGERVLARAEALRAEATWVGLQREALDGSGYPRGAHAPDIPIEARVLGAAAAYIAMREPRAWRAALTHEQAAANLRTEVSAGRLDSGVVRAVLDAEVPRRRGRPRAAALTEREIEVLRLLALGSSNRDIGRDLFISARTAEHHIRSLYDKLGVHTRAAATLWAVRAGLIEPTE